MLILALSVSILMAPMYGCGKRLPPIRLSHLQIEADEAVRLDVVCEEGKVYSIELKPGVPVDIGGPEIICAMYTEPLVELSVETVWK